MENQQKLISLPKELQKLALSESKESRDKLDEMLGACLAVQKLYGRDVANSGTIIDLFQRMMAKYPAVKVIRAFEIWIERSQEFPTPADIIGLIKRNGKQPLSKERYIAISKKDWGSRTNEEHRYMREYDESLENDGWNELPTPKQEQFIRDNEALRQQIIQLKSENERAWAEVKKLRAEAFAKPDLQVQEKMNRTVSFMRENGADEADIQAFLNQGGAFERAA